MNQIFDTLYHHMKKIQRATYFRGALLRQKESNAGYVEYVLLWYNVFNFYG